MPEVVVVPDEEEEVAGPELLMFTSAACAAAQVCIMGPESAKSETASDDLTLQKSAPAYPLL